METQYCCPGGQEKNDSSGLMTVAESSPTISWMMKTNPSPPDNVKTLVPQGSQTGMSITPTQIDQWITVRSEDEHLEFKEAKGSFSQSKLVRYCAALANEGGGRLLLGITDRPPRSVVGSRAFERLSTLTHYLLQRLHIRVMTEEINHPSGRVVVFTVPSRPVGMPIQVDGKYLMRAGESLTDMTPDILRRIFDEAEPDFSANPCPGATLSDLAPEAIDYFRRAWSRKSRNRSLLSSSAENLLEDAELLVEGKVTHAALMLLGTRRALGRLLPQAEVVFEYRSSEASGPAQQRTDHRLGFFLFHNAIWEAIQARNDVQHYQEGLFIWDVPTFHEPVVREALLNAISHRDYRLQGSIFIRQYPRKLVVESPGGLPAGITPDNIIWRQAPRNRRICEAFQRCGLVERSGQGMNRIYEACIRNGNPLPSFTGTDDFQVTITFRGVVEDPRFVAFLEKVGQERLASFTTSHFLAVNEIYRKQRCSPSYRDALADLLEQGIVERSGRGRLLLSRQFHAFLGEKGTYTRKKGLDRETNKALLLKHIQDNRQTGSRMEELMQVLPALNRHQIGRLVRSLKDEGKLRKEGATRATRWYPASRAEDSKY